MQQTGQPLDHVRAFRHSAFAGRAASGDLIFAPLEIGRRSGGWRCASGGTGPSALAAARTRLIRSRACRRASSSRLSSSSSARSAGVPVMVFISLIAFIALKNWQRTDHI